MADNYTEYAKQYGPSGWFDDPTSQSYKGAHGSEVSTTLALYRESVKARFATTGPTDALPLIGNTRQLERAPGEAEADYRVRLTQAFPIHRQRTTEDGYRNALAPLGVDPATVYAWNWWEAGVGNWWSNVYLVADMTSGPWTVDTWDDGVWDDNGVWDLNGVDADGIAYLRRTIRKYKWTGAFPIALWVLISGDIWDAGDTWDDGSVWTDGTAEVFVILLGYHWDQAELLYGGVETWDDGSVWEDAFLT